MTTLTAPRMTTRQIRALTYLKGNRSGLTAPQLRDLLMLSSDSYGTRQTLSVLNAFADKGWAEGEQMTEKVALAQRVGTTGRIPRTRWKITAEGKAALKAAS